MVSYLLEKRCAGACIQPFILVLVILATLSIMIGHACHNYRTSYWLSLVFRETRLFPEKAEEQQIKCWNSHNFLLSNMHVCACTPTYMHTYLIMHRILNVSLCDTVIPHTTQNTFTKGEISKPDPSLFIPIQGQGAHTVCNLFI